MLSGGFGRLITVARVTPHVAWCRKKAPLVTDPSKLRLAFLQPDIPQNLGANIRLAACLGVAVDVIEPCGFPLTDRALRRTAMDYGENVRVFRHSGWSAFRSWQVESGSRLILFTTRGAVRLDSHAFRPDDILLFGRESAGVPDEVHAAADARVLIPLAPGARSLNVAMSAGIALWEAQRQTGSLPPAQDASAR
jgi:tRNA (cytidine/uridine-2'-O-)-methyltransferase